MKSLAKLVRFISLVFVSIISFPSFAAPATVDVMVVYTDGVASLYGTETTSRINQIFQVTNQIYADSGVNLEIRLVKTLQVNYTDDNNAEVALNDITHNRNSAFNQVASIRDQSTADMVVLFRPYKAIHGSCGIAWIGGANGSMSARDKPYMYAHVAINSCGDYVMSHELGHNMGLKHSRKQDGLGGVFHYALGYGVENSFTEIMAYQSEFNVDYWTGKVYKFSNPEILCKNQPCGVDRNNTASGADARYALNITGPQIANFYINSSASSSSSSSQSSVSSSSSKSSSSQSSSAGNLSMTELAAKVEETKKIVNNVTAALAANKTAITEKTTVEKNAKTLLSKATKNADQAKTQYTKAVTKYNQLVTKANSLATSINSAYSKYLAASSTQKTSTAKTYNTLVSEYNTLQSQVTAALAEVKASESAVNQSASELAKATSAYSAAQAVTLAEKAKTAELNANLVAAKNALKDYEAKYKAAVAACRCR